LEEVVHGIRRAVDPGEVVVHLSNMLGGWSSL
jgi:hypothetical protein